MPAEGYLEVPGARLFHRIQGSGPVLLLLPGGDGDADASSTLAARLSGSRTVVTYDRRGLSRSVPEDPGATPGVARHADDAAAVLAAVTDRPADVFGTSIGAVIGIELLCRAPDGVRRLVAHEPPLTQFLPEADRPAAVEGQLAVERAFEAGGVQAAMAAFAGLAGFDPSDREPDVEVRPPDARRLANLEFFITRDAPAVRQHEVDVDVLRSVADKLVLGAGEGSGGSVRPGLIARRLAELLGCPVEEFPGLHNAPTLRPAAVTARLLEILD